MAGALHATHADDDPEQYHDARIAAEARAEAAACGQAAQPFRRVAAHTCLPDRRRSAARTRARNASWRKAGVLAAGKSRAGGMRNIASMATFHLRVEHDRSG